MNELTKNMQKMMVPKAAIIAYKYEDRRNSDTRYFIELRPIGKSGQMGAGIPVTYEFMNTLLESYTEEMSGIPAGRVPENMLACNPRKGQEEYIWYNPPGKRQMFFHKDLNIQDGMFWLTEFSHLGGNVNPTVSNLVIVTENIRNNPFDMNELKSMNKKLKDILP